VEVRIGVTYTAKELLLEIDGTPDEVQSAIDAAFAGGTPSTLWLTDSKGRRVAVPTDKVAYVELTTEDAARRVGFGR
jgi:Protein of unknown function (DUF3107)